MHSLSDSQNWALHAAAVAATAAGLYYAYQAGRASTRKHKQASSSWMLEALFPAALELRLRVFVLAVNLSFKDAAERDKWVATWQEFMVDKVRALEPGTLSYELCVGDKEPLKALVYERYVDKAAYEEVHKTSEYMQRFTQATAGIRVQVQAQTYTETNLGFM